MNHTFENFHSSSRSFENIDARHEGPFDVRIKKLAWKSALHRVQENHYFTVLWWWKRKGGAWRAPFHFRYQRKHRGDHCKTWLTAEDEKNLLKEQEIYVPEDTKAGVIYAFMERFEGDKVCSRQLFECALNHRGEEPKNVETQEICRIVNSGIDKRLLTGWKRLDSPRKFERYGTQRGWIRV